MHPLQRPKNAVEKLQAYFCHKNAAQLRTGKWTTPPLCIHVAHFANLSLYLNRIGWRSAYSSGSEHESVVGPGEQFLMKHWDPHSARNFINKMRNHYVLQDGCAP